MGSSYTTNQTRSASSVLAHASLSLNVATTQKFLGVSRYDFCASALKSSCEPQGATAPVRRNTFSLGRKARRGRCHMSQSSSSSSQLKPYEFRRQFRGPNPGEGVPITADPNYMQIVGTVGVSSGFSFNGQSDFPRGSNNEAAPTKVIDFIADSNPNRGPGPQPKPSAEIIHGKWVGPNRGPAVPATGPHKKSSLVANTGNIPPGTAMSPVVQVEFGSPELVEGPWYRTPTVPTPEPMKGHDQELEESLAQLSSVHNKSAEVVEGPWIIDGIRKNVPASPEWDEGPWILPSAVQQPSFINTSQDSDENRLRNLESSKNFSETTRNVEEVQNLFSKEEEDTKFYSNNDNYRFEIQETDLIGNQYFIEQSISTEGPVLSSHNESIELSHSNVFSPFLQTKTSSIIPDTDSKFQLASTEKSNGVDYFIESENFQTTENIETNYLQSMPSAELTEKPSLVILNDDGTDLDARSYERMNNSSTHVAHYSKSSRIKSSEITTTLNPPSLNEIDDQNEPNVLSNSSNSPVKVKFGVFQQYSVDVDPVEYDTQAHQEQNFQLSLENEEFFNVSGDYVSFNDSNASSFGRSEDFRRETSKAYSNEFFPESENLHSTQDPHFSIEATYERMSDSLTDNLSVSPLSKQDLVNEENILNVSPSSNTNSIFLFNIDKTHPTSQVHAAKGSTSDDNSSSKLHKYDSVFGSDSSLNVTPATKKVVVFKHPTAISVVRGPSFGARQGDEVEPVVAEARSPSKLPDRLPSNQPYFFAPGLRNSQENLHSLDDLYTRGTHEIQYFVGEKAEKMKKIQMNASEALMPPPALPLPILGSYEQFISNEKNEANAEGSIPLVDGVIHPAVEGPYSQTFSSDQENNNDDISLLSVLGYFGKLDESQKSLKESSPTGINENQDPYGASSLHLNPNNSKENRVHDSPDSIPSTSSETTAHTVHKNPSAVLFSPVGTTRNRAHDGVPNVLFGQTETNKNLAPLQETFIPDSQSMVVDYYDAAPSILSRPTGTTKNISHYGTSSVEFSVVETEENLVSQQATLISDSQQMAADYSKEASTVQFNSTGTKKNHVHDGPSSAQFSSFDTKENNVHDSVLNQFNPPESKDNRVYDGALSVLFNPTGTKENHVHDNTPRVLFRPVKAAANFVHNSADSFLHKSTETNENYAHDGVHSVGFSATETNKVPVDKNTLGLQVSSSGTTQNVLRKDITNFGFIPHKSEETHVHNGDSTRLINVKGEIENLVQSNNHDQHFYATPSLPQSYDDSKYTGVLAHFGSDDRHDSEHDIKYSSLSPDKVNPPSVVSSTASQSAAVVTKLKPVYVHLESGETSFTAPNTEKLAVETQYYKTNTPVNEVLLLSNDDTNHNNGEMQSDIAGIQQSSHSQHQIQSVAQDRKFEVHDPKNLVGSSTSDNMKHFSTQKYKTPDNTRERVFAEGHLHHIKVQSNQDTNTFELIPKREHMDNSYDTQTALDSGNKLVEHNSGVSLYPNVMLPPPALQLPMPQQKNSQTSHVSGSPVQVEYAHQSSIVKLPPVSVQKENPPNKPHFLHIPGNSYYTPDVFVPPLSHDLMPPRETHVLDSQPMVSDYSESSAFHVSKEQSALEVLNLRDSEQGLAFGQKSQSRRTEVNDDGLLDHDQNLQQQRQRLQYSDHSQSEAQSSSGAYDNDNHLKETESAIPHTEKDIHVSLVTPTGLESLSEDFSLPSVPARRNSVVSFPALTNTDDSDNQSRLTIPLPSPTHHLPKSFSSGALKENPVSHYQAPQQSIYQSPSLGRNSFTHSGSDSQNMNFLRPPPPPLPAVIPVQKLPLHLNPTAPGRHWNSHVRPPVTASQPPYVLVPLNRPHTPSYELALRNFSPPPSLLHQFSLLRSSPYRPPPKIQVPLKSQTFKNTETETTTPSFTSTSLVPVITPSKVGWDEKISSEIERTEAPHKNDEEPENPTVVVAVPIHKDSELSRSENNFLSVSGNYRQDLKNLNSSRESTELLKLDDSTDLLDADEGNSYHSKTSLSQHEEPSVSGVESPSERSSLSMDVDYDHILSPDPMDKFSDTSSGSSDLRVRESALRSSSTGAASSESHAPDATLKAPQVASPEHLGETRRKSNSAVRHSDAQYDDDYYEDGQEDDDHRGEGFQNNVQLRHDLFKSDAHFNNELHNDIRRLAALAIDALDDDVQLHPLDGRFEDKDDEDVHPDLGSGPEAECWAFTDQELIINPGADVFIGVALPLSSSEGLESCGPLQGPWVASLEALKWGLARLNQDRGQVGHRILTNSYVPGVKFGARIVDTCSTSEKRSSIMEIFYPQLSGVPHCPPPPALFSAGVINLATPSSQKILGLPILDVGPSVVVPPADRARATLQTTAMQSWNRTLLLVEQHSYHLNMAELITSQSPSYNVCISAVEYLPRSGENQLPGKYRDVLGRVRRLLRFGGLDGVVVVASERVLLETLSAVGAAAPHLRADVPWLLTDIPTAESAAIRRIVSAGLSLQLLTTMPPLAEFEKYWQDLPSALTETTPASDTFLQYLLQQTGCRTPGDAQSADYADCRSVSVADIEKKDEDVAGLDVVARARTVVPALHALFTLAKAVQEAWRRKCNGRPGVCRSLQALSLQEFYYSFLSGLEFDHVGPGARSPLGLKGGKMTDDPAAQLAGSSLSVYRVLDIQGNITTALTMVMLDGGREVLNASSLRPPRRRKRPCFGRHCAACLSSPPQLLEEESVKTRTSVPAEPHVFLPSPQDVYVVGMFAVHETSDDGTGCGPALRAEAIQEVEAMLWAVQQINRHSQLLPSTQMGVVVLDTCGAQIRATNQVTNIIKETLPGLNIGLDNIYAFITSLDLDTAKVVGEMLASLNITSMNLGQSLAHSPFALQMSPPPNLEAEALVQILQYLGWDFVSMVVSGSHTPSTIAASALHTVARAARVCVGLELSLTSSTDEELNLQRVTKVVSRLVEFSAQGARAVLLFLEPSDAQRLVGAVNSAQLSGLIDPQQLILISGSGWGDNTDQILAPSSPPGSVLLKDGQQDVQDFSLHYRLLTPENNTRNPWFRDFWIQEFGCGHALCSGAPDHPPVLPYRPTPPTPRVVQAVFSFGAAFTQLLHHLCPHAAGHMCPGLAKWRRRTVLNEFLRNTEVSRVDKPQEFFQFTENFHGNAPLEVVNVQRTPVRSALALPAVDPTSDNAPQLNYVQVGRYFNGELSMKTPLAEASNRRLVPLDSLPSSCTASCAATCTHQDTDYIFVESPDKVYIVAALNVHTAGSRPLECGPLRGDQGIQEVEAFLWALARANEASKRGGSPAGEVPRAVPQIGAVVFDACSNKEKVVRDVTNLLTGRLQERIRQMLPSSDHIIGVVVGGRGEVPQQVLDITQPYGITSITTLATHSDLSNTRRFPAVLHLAPSNYLKAEAMLSILERYDWSLFSIVYSDGGEAGDTAKHLLRGTSKKNLEAAVTEPIPLQVEDPTYMLEVWGRLAEGVQQGSRAVLLLLQSRHLELFLLTGASLRQQGLLRQGDFVFLMTESPAPYLRDPSFGLNTLVVQPLSGPVPAFAKHFLGLSLLNHTSPYPWFAEFWAQVFGCQGASCLTGPPQSLGAVTRRLRISEGVPATAGAVNVLASSLRSSVRTLCNESTEALCNSFLTQPEFRESVFRAARAHHGRTLDHQPYAFGDDGRNVKAVLQVLNYREIGHTRIHTLVKVGEFSEDTGLLLNSSLALSYDSMGEPRPMTDVRSKCSNATLCGKEEPMVEKMQASLEKQVDALQNTSEMNYIQIYPSKRFGISGLVPFHKKGKQFFTCGDYSGEPIFQNLAAVAFALNQINSNTDDDLGLGAIFFDYCDRNERAREQMFSFYSGETADNDPSVSLTPDKIVASLSFDDEAAESVSSILSSNHIPHFSSPVAGVMQGYRKDASIISSVPSRTAEIHVYLSILREFNWKYVSVIFDNDSVGKNLAKTFKKLAKSVHICIGDTFGVHKIVSEEYAQELVEALSEEWKPRVIILLVDDASNIKTILEVAQRMGKGETFLFLAGRSWGNKADLLNGLNTIGSGALTFSLETYDLPDFRLFLANMTLDNHDPIPDSWFHDYFQNRFECRLSQAERSVEHFRRECDGSERIHADDIVQDPFVFHTILSVNAIAHGLDAYMRKQCKNFASVRECNIVQSEVLMEIVHQGRSSLNDSSDSSPYSQGGAYGYQLWNYRDIGGIYSYISAGKWENGLINLDIKNIRFKAGDQFIPESECNEGPCVEVCASQSTVYAALRIPDPLPIDVNFKSVYGITTATLSLVGVIIIIVAIVYFMMTFPTAAGTSVLGYMILSGCLFIYASNFAFIFQPTVGTCAVRRSLMGIGYATAFASMLVKVMHTWRLSSSSDEENYISLTRPGVLFLVAVCLSLVQAVLSAAWLILYPPAVDLLGNVWRCTPSDHFESDLVISLIYVMVLIAATILFSLETWQFEENAKETRWILLSSLLCVVFWLVWTIVATKAPVPLRDPAIVIGNLSCATVIVLFLYARKLYLASQLSKDVRDLELRSHFTAASSIYNASLAAKKMGADQAQDNIQQTDQRLRQFDGNDDVDDDDDDDYVEEINSSGRQFVGDQEVSFKKVTLPPERRFDPSKASSNSSGAPRPAHRKSLGLTFSDEVPVDFKFDDFSSSVDDGEDHFMVDASDLMSDEEGSDEEGSDEEGSYLYGDEDGGEFECMDERVARIQDTDSRRRGPAIRRVGSRQMLVFLNDGHIGDVSRI
ncbi:Receptor ligand binding region [Trinorchestia longiramus]|nr:Receptor ligand binding region [Trinorchestia longiramus]